MALHGMIDLETLGTKPNTAILTIGAIKFDPFTNNEPHNPLYLHVDVDEQTETLERSVDQNTLDWWQQQKDSVREEAFRQDNRINLDNVTKKLNKWCVGVEYLWCHGPLFDYCILENLYTQLGKPIPWSFWQIRDSRTLFGMMTKDPRTEIQEELHNALADSYYQAKCVQTAYQHFKVKKR